MQSFGEIKIFAANANEDLAASIARNLNVELGNSSVTQFSDGEINMRVNETVRGSDVFIIQSTSPPVNDHLMELLIMIDAMHRSSAGRITAVIPYFGYARQDRKARSHDPISAKLVANLLTTAGADRVLSMDLHSPQIQGFFDIPCDHLRGVYLFAEYYKNLFEDMSDVVVVSPDLGSVARCNGFADLLDVPLAIVDKRRPRDNVSEVAHFIGEVEGKTAILLDDVLSTGGSLVNAAATVKEKGAKAVYACVTHPVLAGDAVKLLENSELEEVVFLDTISIPKDIPCDKISLDLSVTSNFCDRICHTRGDSKIKVLSAATILANAIYCIHNGKSIGDLYKIPMTF